MTTVGVVGLGYVGLTLAVALAHRGFVVHGVDKSPPVLAVLREGRPHLFEPGLEEGLAQWIGSRIHVADELPAGEVDVVVICVSTPVDPQTMRPQLENLKRAARHVAERGRPDTLVVVRSTVPVGASRGIVLPELAARWPAPRLAFAPERTIQGQALRELEELPQVVGGLDAVSANGAVELFSQLTRRVVRASSLEAAELVKLVNNCHTDLIYGYGNEVALLAQRFGLDPLEVIHCANVEYPRPDLSRPGFVGGGCLSKDPYILLSAAAETGYTPYLVGAARRLNEDLPVHVAERLVTLIRTARPRGRLPARRAGLGVQGLAADRRHARRRRDADAAALPGRGPRAARSRLPRGARGDRGPGRHGRLGRGGLRRRRRGARDGEPSRVRQARSPEAARDAAAAGRRLRRLADLRRGDRPSRRRRVRGDRVWRERSSSAAPASSAPIWHPGWPTRATSSRWWTISPGVGTTRR